VHRILGGEPVAQGVEGGAQRRIGVVRLLEMEHLADLAQPQVGFLHGGVEFVVSGHGGLRSQQRRTRLAPAARLLLDRGQNSLRAATRGGA